MKQATFLVAIVVGLAVGLGFVLGGVTLGPDETVFKSYENDWWRGVACTGNDVTAASTGRLLDADDYIASWSTNLIGQRVTMHGGLQWKAGPLRISLVEKLHYKITLDQHDGKGEVEVLDTDIAASTGIVAPLVGATYCYASAYWDMRSLDGKTVIPEGATLHALLYYKEWGDKWYLMADQRARVHTGIGVINREQGQVVVGNTACWTYHVGYVSDDLTGRGWTVYVTSGAQGGATVVPEQRLAQTDGRICYKATDADFSAASSHNELTAHLKNEIQDKSYDITTTVTQALLATAPTCEIGTVSPGSPRQGDVVTVNFACTPVAGHPLKLIKVIYGWGGIDQTDELGPDATSDTFTAAQSGYVRLMVIAYTTENVPSATKSVDIQIEHQLTKGCGYGTDNSTCVLGGLDFIPLIAAAIVLVIGLIVATGVGRGKPLWFLLIFLGFLAVAAFAYFALGGGG